MSRDDPLYEDGNLVQFYDLENGWGPDFDFCAGLAAGARSVLDLGCGTGELAAKLAETCEVVGVDPAAAMLAVARARPGGDRVEWLEGDARDLRLDRRFDLILLTGHAFQVFLTPEDQLAALRTIALHLNPRGRFIFDSRNPAVEEWREWVPEESREEITHPKLGAVEAWNDVAYDPATGIATYETHYRVVSTGQHFSATSQIRFTPKDELEALISEAGLHVTQWYGDWQGGPCTADSKELIPLGGLVQLA
ncbi:class I SAM-dependent methyltransferase [Pelagibius marinus]|uniref:class I SAM-dependent methyltransferase n=1 Tax=Pelagibius marinus TaxID=2762760 RepID=UPI0018733868|nr:class I SAM-dependent methyltransferase [Pelagibius marinus]